MAKILRTAAMASSTSASDQPRTSGPPIDGCAGPARRTGAQDCRGQSGHFRDGPRGRAGNDRLAWETSLGRGLRERFANWVVIAFCQGP